MAATKKVRAKAKNVWRISLRDGDDHELWVTHIRSTSLPEMLSTIASFIGDSDEAPSDETMDQCSAIQIEMIR